MPWKNEKTKHTIFVGHYGTGKTSVAVNYAVELRKKTNKKVYLIDLDIVNPYFGSFDNADILSQNDVTLLAPAFAGTNLEAPSLPQAIQRVFSQDCIAVWDMGGDDAGAVVIGGYHDRIAAQGYEMLYVVNRFRPLTPDASSMLEIIKEIESASRLRVTGIVNNSNLGQETTPDDVIRSCAQTGELSRISGLPIVFTSVTKGIADGVTGKINGEIFRIDLYTRKFW